MEELYTASDAVREARNANKRAFPTTYDILSVAVRIGANDAIERGQTSFQVTLSDISEGTISVYLETGLTLYEHRMNGVSVPGWSTPQTAARDIRTVDAHAALDTHKTWTWTRTEPLAPYAEPMELSSDVWLW